MAVDYRTTPLKKSDLQFTYPAGAAGSDNPALRAAPDSYLLNRNEWYEVLYFVNKFATENGGGNPEVAKKAERLIHRYLPSDKRGQATISEWLIKNWDVYGSAPIV